MDTKSIFQSRTMWGAFVALLCGVLGLFGYSIGDADQSQLVETLVAVAGIVGSLVAMYGRVKASKSVTMSGAAQAGKVGLLVLAVSLPLLTVQGCALSDLEPHEKAFAVGEEITADYKALYSEYNALHAQLTPEGVAFLEERVAPVMDATKLVIIAYRDAAQLYARTKEEPANWATIAADAESALASSWALVLEARNYIKGDD